MNLNPLLSRFMDLVTYDKAVHQIEDEIDMLLDAIFALEEEQKRSSDVLQKEREHVRELKKDVDARELEMKTLDEKVRAAKVKFSTASNAREYELLKKEVDTASHEQHEFEDTLLTTWSAYEVAQKSLKHKEATSQETTTTLQALLKEKEQKKTELEAVLTEKMLERTTKEQGLPEQWLADYTRMRGSVANPVVPLENGACSACFESLSSQEIAVLARKQLAPCCGCFRFLFIKP